jgi:hypothetical protein
MNRNEVLTHLGQILVFLRNDYTIAVILPNHNEVKQFAREFYNKIDELPTWLGIDIARRTISECKSYNGKILFVSNPAHLRGRTISTIYRSKRALTQANSEELEYFNFLAAIAQQPVMDFDDE